MPRISPTGQILPSPNLNLSPKTDGKRRLSDWIASFLECNADLESPIDYFRWSALSTLGGAAQRKIYMANQAFTAYPNMYVILTGPPGTKKGAAIRAGRKLLKKVPGVYFTPDAPSVVGIMKAFNAIPQRNHQSLNSFIFELSTLYENAGENMTGFLTAIYDCDEGYKKWTRVGGEEEIPYPWFNLLAGTTPQWLGDNMRKSAVEGGLFSRTIYVYSEEIILKSSWPALRPELLRLEEALIHDLAHISVQSFVFDFDGGKDGDAFKWYDAWYLNRSRFPKGADNRIIGYFMRKPTHIIKVAMAVALSRSDRQVLTLDDLMTAKSLLEVVEPGMAQAFSGVGTNEFAVEIERVGRLVKQAGASGMTYANLIAATYHNLELPELQRALQTLVSWGRIEGDLVKGFRPRA